MSEPFLAEIRIFGFNFAPRGWAFCDGQVLPINQNQALFSLLGTTYGGDGRSTFALPDLRGRVPIHVGQSGGETYQLGQRGGEETHEVAIQEMPGHNHAFQASSNAASAAPGSGNVLGSTDEPGIYVDSAKKLVTMSANQIAATGGGQSHENRQPYQVLTFCIALQGLFPSRD
jgi:microcystin-dependent protein